jgi:hypothetical protein
MKRIITPPTAGAVLRPEVCAKRQFERIDACIDVRLDGLLALGNRSQHSGMTFRNQLNAIVHLFLQNLNPREPGIKPIKAFLNSIESLF